MSAKPLEVIDAAVAEHKPAAVFAMFSGGHDSVCSTHIAAQPESRELEQIAWFYPEVAAHIRELERKAFDAGVWPN